MNKHTDEQIENELTVTLTLDNDEEITCIVLCTYTASSQEYIALLPLGENGEVNDEGDVFIYRYSESDGQPVLDNIETDEEYDVASEAFDEWLDAQEFNEIQANLDLDE